MLNMSSITQAVEQYIIKNIQRAKDPPFNIFGEGCKIALFVLFHSVCSSSTSLGCIWVLVVGIIYALEIYPDCHNGIW